MNWHLKEMKHFFSMRKLPFFLGGILAITVLISCKKEVEVTGITLDKPTLTLELGKWETLTATILPKNATDKSVTWLSQNATIASVADGVVFGNMGGTTNIIAKAGNYTAICEVTVRPPSLAGTIWKGIDTDGDQCTLTLTNATDCTLDIVDYGYFSGTYSLLNYPSISVNIPSHWNFLGTIVGNTMTLKNSAVWGTYGMTLTKQ